MMHKYNLKTFYNRINKKRYKSQIWQYNIYHTSIIIIKNVITLQKAREEEKLSEDSVNTIVSAKVTQELSLIYIVQKYKSAIGNADIDVTKELGLIEVKKYRRYTG